MNPVYQKIVSDKDGDCFDACMASLLHIDYQNFSIAKSGSQVDTWNKWLRARNLQIITYELGSFPVPVGYAILSVKSAVFEKTTHAVIFCGNGWTGKVVHNPNLHDPRGTSIPNDDWLRFTVIALIDPSKHVSA